MSPEPSSVSLYEYGKGIYSIHIEALENNRLSQGTIAQIQQALATLKQTDSAKVLILKGTAKTFLSGGRKSNNWAIEQQLFKTIASFPYPIIAAMQGNATGAGFLIGALCDFMICAMESNYSYTDVQEGIYPSEAEDLFFKERIGENRATNLLYKSTLSTGKQLRTNGWDCPILPHEQVENYAQKLAESLAEKSHKTLRLLKKHLSRHIVPLANALTVEKDLTNEHQTNTIKAEVKVTTPSKQIRLETHAKNVLVVHISAAKKAIEIKKLLAELSPVFEQLKQRTHYKTIVLVSEYDGFLSEKASEAEVLELQRLILESPLPVIAALSANAKGIAWLIGQFCDACIYNEKGSYSLGDIEESPELARQAAIMFLQRFGSHAATEILMTRNEYTGFELRQRTRSLTLAEKSHVLPTALQLAESWGRLPIDSIETWKKREALRIREKIKKQPAWSAPKEEKEKPHKKEASPLTLNSKVVTATIYSKGILLVKMEEREAKNMFSEAMVEGIKEVFEHIEQTPQYKVVVLTGYDQYFSSGGTKNTLLAIQEGKTKFTDNNITHFAATCKIPVIAAMQGHGVGGGWTLGMFADFTLFSEESKYFSPYMNYGFTPGAGATFIFPEKMGHDLARETMLTAREYSGIELKNNGLIWDVLPRKQVVQAAMGLAGKIAERSRSSLVAFKHQLTHHIYNQVQETYKLELSMHDKTFVGQSDALKQISDNFIQKNSLPQSETNKKEEPSPSFAMNSSTNVKESIKKILAEELHLQEKDIDENTPFIDLGLDSITGVTLMRKINQKYKTSIEATKVYSYPTLIKLSRFVKEKAENVEPLSEKPEAKQQTVSGSRIQQQNNVVTTHSSPNTDILPTVSSSIKKLLAEELHLQEQYIDENTPFIDMGLDSITGVTWMRRINQKYKTSIEATKVYSHPTLKKLSRYVEEVVEKVAPPLSNKSAIQLSSISTPNALSHKVAGKNLSANADTLPFIMEGVKKLLAVELHLQEQDIDEDTPFINLGLDSITGVTLMRKINEKYKTSIGATKVYSYPTLIKLSRYVKEEAEKLGELYNNPVLDNSVTSIDTPETSPRKAVYQPVTRKLVSWRNKRPSRINYEGPSEKPSSAIAVVGMAGQFPQAKNLDEFWQNIAQGKNCIDEIPQERWSLDNYYQEGNVVSGKTNSKWSGTLEEYDMFDPLFFNISPTEAESMDPQQRLFLQACWHTIENAGYNPKKLSGTKCSVYVGCGQGDYRLLSKDLQLSAQGFSGGDTSILAGRISYYLNLHGPSLSIQTACSSSLVAIAHACDSLVAGTSDSALAGGVYVMTGPEVHIKCSQMNMLSTDGKCYTFDQRANGFVPGEGVGVVMLKRLADAEKDQDRILGVIQGWGSNQDGKTNGITAPNPESQSRLEQEVYNKFQINPEEIQLVEAHGTGTKLGDPIEVDALKDAYRKYTRKKEYCALGSVKSNIGHCLTAAGVASFIKVLLAMKHKQLPPTINYNNINEHISLKDSPFYINDRLQDWELKGAPKRQAVVSAFGFSGTNAHIALSEYVSPTEAKPLVSAITQNGGIIIPLSARNEEQLTQKAIELLSFIQKEPSTNLIDMAYTLQVGREEMGERLGLMASTIEQLAEKLQAYINGEKNIEGLRYGKVKQSKESLSIISQDEEVKETIVEKYIAQKNLSKLLDLWANGMEFNWDKLYGEVKPNRIALPVYPFAKERYWVETEEPEQVTKNGAFNDVLHPLLHRNTSTLQEQCYRSTFTGEEQFLKDHQVNGQKILPAVAYLEMVRSAVENAMPDIPASSVLELHNTVWMQPIVVTENKEITIALLTNNENGSLDEQIDYEVYSTNEGQEILHCQGQAIFSPNALPAKIDILKTKSQMQQGKIEAANIYSIFSGMGLNYGPAHQGIISLFQGEKQLLAELRLPAVSESSQNDYLLHPSLMDSALQSSIGLTLDRVQETKKPILPFAINFLRVISACTKEMFAWVRYTSENNPDHRTLKMDIDLCDTEGNVCVQMKGFTSRFLEGEIKQVIPAASIHPPTNNNMHTIERRDSFDNAHYQKLMDDILSKKVSVDEAVGLE